METSHGFNKKQVRKSITKLHNQVSNFIFKDCLADCNEGKPTWQLDLIIQWVKFRFRVKNCWPVPDPSHDWVGFTHNFMCNFFELD